MKVAAIVFLLAIAFSAVARAQQSLSPSQIALAQMAAIADAYKANADKFTAENADLRKENAVLKAKCGKPCKDTSPEQK